MLSSPYSISLSSQTNRFKYFSHRRAEGGDDDIEKKLKSFSQFILEFVSLLDFLN